MKNYSNELNCFLANLVLEVGKQKTISQNLPNFIQWILSEGTPIRLNWTSVNGIITISKNERIQLNYNQQIKQIESKIHENFTNTSKTGKQESRISYFYFFLIYLFFYFVFVIFNINFCL